jgi:general secretion pathway protein I
MIRANRRASGFTLLEAIVALVIMAAVMIPLLSFISATAQALITAAETNERSFAQQAAVAMLEPLNPLEEPAGTLSLDQDVTVSWTSEAILPLMKDVALGSPLSGFTFGFYKLTVTLARPDRNPWFTFEMRKAGYAKHSMAP